MKIFFIYLITLSFILVSCNEKNTLENQNKTTIINDSLYNDIKLKNTLLINKIDSLEKMVSNFDKFTTKALYGYRYGKYYWSNPQSWKVPSEIYNYLKENYPDYYLPNERRFPYKYFQGTFNFSLNYPFITRGDFNNDDRLDYAFVLAKHDYNFKGYIGLDHHFFVFLSNFLKYNLDTTCFAYGEGNIGNDTDIKTGLLGLKPGKHEFIINNKDTLNITLDREVLLFVRGEDYPSLYYTYWIGGESTTKCIYQDD